MHLFNTEFDPCLVSQTADDDDDSKPMSNGHDVTKGHTLLPYVNGVNAVPSNGFSAPWGMTTDPSTENELSMQANRESAEGTPQQQRRRSADMCGSLHLSGSPSSCVSHRPAWGAVSSDSGESLHYGHYHGFGDTAEELTDTSSRLEHRISIRVEQRYNQAVVSAMQLYHGS